MGLRIGSARTVVPSLHTPPASTSKPRPDDGVSAFEPPSAQRFTRLGLAQPDAGVIVPAIAAADARAVPNLQQLAQMPWFQAQGEADQRLSVDMISRLSTHGGDRTILDNTLARLLDPSSPLQVRWSNLGAEVFGQRRDNVIELNRQIAADPRFTAYLMVGTVAHEVSHHVHDDVVEGSFEYFEDEYRSWYIAYQAYTGRTPTAATAMNERLINQINGGFYGGYTAQVHDQPAEAAQLYDFFTRASGLQVTAENWAHFITMDTSTWPRAGQPAPVPSGNLTNG